MNSPSPFSSRVDPTDIAELLSEPEPPAAREGLPAGFRMRANSHYVDELDAPAGPVFRTVAVSAIETESSIAAADALVNSVRKHGVLEPLLVQHDPRGRQYRLITGRSRLAAARAAGLREVPCVVHAISDAEAEELTAATHTVERRAAAAPEPAREVTASLYPAQRELQSALDTIESCSPMLTQGSPLARRGAAQVIAAECRRAQRALKAMSVLDTGMPVRRAIVRPLDLLHRLRDSFRAEQRLLGTEPTIQVHADPQLTVYADDELLLAAFSSAMSALTAAAGERHRDVSFTATAIPAGTVVELIDHGLGLSESFIRAAFTAAWPIPEGDAALMLLQTARGIVTAHGGSISLAHEAAGTTVRLQLPAASRSGDGSSA